MLMLVVAALSSATVAPIASARAPLVLGTVEVAVAMPFSRTWNPQTQTPVHIVVTGRLRRNQRVGQVAFVRSSPGRARCGPSYTRGRGKPVGAFTIKRPTKDGYFTVDTARPRTFTRVGNVRFCVWVAPTAGTRVVPQVHDIPFHERMFGAAITGTGTFDTSLAKATTWVAISTVPFTTMTTVVGGCLGLVDTRTATTNHPRRTNYFANEGGATFASDPSCIEVRTHSYRLNGGMAGEVDAGGFTFSRDAARTVPPTITALGPGCVLNSFLASSVSEVQRYIRAVGCTPGRVIRRRSGSTPAGQVVGFEIHGIDAKLAARGTTIDIVISDPSAP